MHGEEWQIRVERSVLVFTDELHRFVHDALSRLRIILMVRHGQIGLRIPELHVAFCAFAIRQFLGKALRAGIELAAAEMPLPAKNVA